MISEGEKEEIRTLIKVGRKRAINFGICMGEDPVETVFVMHRRTIPRVLGTQARNQGTTAKVAKGRMEVDGRTLRLCCEGSKPTGLAKNLKKYLKLLKLNMSVVLADDVAELPVEDEEEEDVQAEVLADPAGSAPRGAEMDGATDDGAAPAPEVSPEQSRFEALAEPLQAQIAELTGAQDPRAKKVAAIWDLAQKRADEGDYATAIKAVTSLAARL